MNPARTRCTSLDSPRMDALEERLLLSADWTGTWRTMGYQFEADASSGRPFIMKPDAIRVAMTDMGDTVQLTPQGSSDVLVLQESPSGTLTFTDTFHDDGCWEVERLEVFPISEDAAYYVNCGACYSFEHGDVLYTVWGSAGIVYRGSFTPTARPWTGDYDIVETSFEPDPSGIDVWPTQFAGTLHHLGGNRYVGAQLGEEPDPDETPYRAKGRVLARGGAEGDQDRFLYEYEYILRGPADDLIAVDFGAWFDANRETLYGGSIGVSHITPRPGSEYLPDLVSEIGRITLPQPSVPGDRGVVQVELHNEGNAPARGIVQVDLFTSADDQLDAQDTLVASQPVRINIPAGRRQVVSLRVEVPSDAEPGSDYLIADVDTADAIDELSEANNVAATGEPGTVAWQFGEVGDRRNVRLILNDAQDRPVLYRLLGPGTGEIGWHGDHPCITVTGSDPRTLLTITPLTRGAEATVDTITIQGDARGIVAPKVDLDGDVSVHGAMGRLVMDDTSANRTHRIEIWTDPGERTAPPALLSIALDQAYNLSVESHDLGLGAITATAWASSAGPMPHIQADSVSVIRIRGRRANPRRHLEAVDGDFVSDLNLSGRHLVGRRAALNGLIVAGDAMGHDWWLHSAGAIRTAGDLRVDSVTFDAETEGPALAAGKIVVGGRMQDTDLRSNGNVGAVVIGEMHQSNLFAGVANAIDGRLPNPNSEFERSTTIKRVVITGIRGEDYRGGERFAMTQSYIAAESIGSARVVYARADNDGDPFGFAAAHVRSFFYADADNNVIRHPSRGVQTTEVGDFTLWLATV